MEWLFRAIGVSLVFAGIADVFVTVLHPDGFGFLSSCLYNRLFDSVRLLRQCRIEKPFHLPVLTLPGYAPIPCVDKPPYGVTFQVHRAVFVHGNF